MKKYLISIVLVSIFASSVIAKPKKGEKIATLTETSESLKQFEGNEEYNFIKGASIVYKVIENGKYDNIFKESAYIYSTIIQIKGTLGLINDGKVKLASDFAVSSIAFAGKDLPTLEDKITNLQNAIKKLKPKEDFKGKEMSKATKATAGIKIASDQLANSLKELPNLLEELKGITEKK